MRFFRSILCLLVLFGGLGRESAQAVMPYHPRYGDPVTEPWRWTSFDELQGQRTYCMVEGGDGSLWFGITTGVVHYDGREWSYFTPADGLRGVNVQSLACGLRGEVYAGSGEGISCFEEGAWRPVFPVDPNRQQRIFSLAVANDGSVWAGLQYGVLRLHQGKRHLYTGLGGRDALPASKQDLFDQVVVIQPHVQPKTDDGMPLGPRVYGPIQKIQEGRAGRLWFHATRYILSMTPKETSSANGLWHVYRIPDQVDVPRADVRGLLEDTTGTLWMVGHHPKRGIGRLSLEEGSWEVLFLQKQFGGDNRNYGIIQSRDGTIWVTGMNRLFCYRGHTWQKYEASEFHFNGSPTIRVFEKSDSSLWLFGTHQGLMRLERGDRYWMTLQDLIFQAEAPDGTEWFIGSDNRLIRHQNGQWISYGEEDGVVDVPTGIVVTRTGRVWVAGSHDGRAAVARWDGSSWERSVHEGLSWSVAGDAIFEDGDGRLWFGAAYQLSNDTRSKGGLLLYDPFAPNPQNPFRHYVDHDEKRFSISGIAQDLEGGLWLGGRVRRFHERGFETVNQPQPLTLSLVDAVCAENDGTLWLGSRFYGLFRGRDKEWTRFGRGTGLIDNAIVACTPGVGCVWTATRADISCFDGREWTHYVTGRHLTIPWNQGGLRVAANGALWINRWPVWWEERASENKGPQNRDTPGLWAVRFQPQKQDPQTLLLHAPDRVGSAGDVVLAWEGTDVWNRTHRENLTYSYRINGGQWSRFAHTTQQMFLGLTPGRYTFEVRARDSDMNIDPSPAQAVFVVVPPIWKQPWFIALMSTFIFLIGWLAWRLVQLHELRVTRELEFDKQQAEKQLEVDEQRLRFFTNISHELRTPLTLILGPLERLLARIQNREEREQLSLAQSNAQRLLRLINQLLDMRKLQQGQLKLEATNDDIVRFTSDIVASFRVAAEDKGLRLTFVSEATELSAWFDPDKFEKILLNLISNAIKFTPAGGEVTVRLTRETYHPPQTMSQISDAIVIEVQDTGLGIAAADLPQVFDRFYQTQHSGPCHDGTGIGLSLTKELVELHGGALSVVSPVPGPDGDRSGSCFTVRLPLIQKSPLEGTSVSISKASDAEDRPLILLVEDSDDMRRFIRTELAETYRIQEAENGKRGLESARQSIPDLVVSDVMMPEMDGFALCAALKADVLTSHIPVILLTARGSDLAQVEGLESGADDYIVKPFSSPVLQARIHNLLKSRKALQERFTQQVVVKPKDITVSAPDVNFLDQAIAIVESHMDDYEFTPEAFAQEMSMSSRSLYRKLKGVTGQPVAAFIRTIRLKRAAQLLTTGQYTTTQVAFMVGFLDRVHFSRSFKQQFGVSPSEYAKGSYSSDDDR